MKQRKPRSRFKSPKNNPNTLLLLLALLAGFVGYLMWYNSTHQETEQVIYSSFVENVERGHVARVAVLDGMHVRGVYRKSYHSGGTFEVAIRPSEDLWKKLRQHGVMIDFKNSEKQPWGGVLFFLFFPLLFLLGFLYFRQAGSGGGGNGKIFSMGKSKARYFAPHSINVNFSNVAGVHEAKEDLRDIIEFLQNPHKFERLGAKIPCGILLEGSPGNGKTLLAKAVAGEAYCPFFSMSGSDFVEVFVGVGASRVRDLFQQARKAAPCIVFIDEIDAVGRKRGVGMGGGNDEREQTLNQLLAEMDGFATERGSVIILAATNRVDVLDNALLRPGRFDRVIQVPYPDMKSRMQILNVHLKPVPVSGDVDIERLARGTPGFSGAELENLINEAALSSAKAGKHEVDVEDFEFARDKIILGAERKTMVLSQEERRMTAYHEGGHALVNLLLPHTDPFHKVTIVPRGRALGVSHSLPEKDKYSQSKTAMLERVQVCLGGLAAEKIVFNEQTSGASSDIKNATNIIRQMVCSYGMSELGPITFSDSENNSYYMKGSSGYSEATAEKIDAEITRMMDEALKKTEKLLLDNHDKLVLLAEKLLEVETVHAAEAYELLGLKPREGHSFRQDSDNEDDDPMFDPGHEQDISIGNHEEIDEGDQDDASGAEESPE